MTKISNPANFRLNLPAGLVKTINVKAFVLTCDSKCDLKKI